MAVPTHKPSCFTWTTGIACWDCRQDVFYFQCSCGSKVLFRTLGGDWEKHDCRLRRSKAIGAIAIHLKSYDHRVLEWAVMQIADVATSTGAGMRLPALSPNRSEYLIKILNASAKAIAAFQNLSLPLSVEVRIDGTDDGPVHAVVENKTLVERAMIVQAQMEKELERLAHSSRGTRRRNR